MGSSSTPSTSTSTSATNSAAFHCKPLHSTIISIAPSISTTKAMKGKTPVLVLSQHAPQPASSIQSFRSNSHINNHNNNNNNTCGRNSPSYRRSSHFHTQSPQQQQQQTQEQTQQQQQNQRSLLMRKPSGNVGQKHQYYHHQQYDHHNNFDRNFRQLDYPRPQQSYFNYKECQYSHSNTHHTQRNAARLPMQSINSPRSDSTATPLIPSQESSSSSTSIPSFVVSTDSTPVAESSTLSSSVHAVTLAAVVGGAEAHNSDPEPALGDVEKYLENQHQLLQSNRLSQEARSHKSASSRSSASRININSRSQLSAELGLGLCPPGAMESDISSNSSMRESSDYDTLETEDDDKGIPGSDSNDTDSIVEDAMALDKRSQRKRSMQRLVAKNKTLKSSLQQAKADLAAERHNRAMIDQIYLKIRKELSSKLEAEEFKVANLRAELDQMTQDMQELKEKSTSYKIGYDSSAYSLSSGLGGLMLHHSNIPDCDEDEEEEEETFIEAKKSSRAEEDSSPSHGWHTQEERKVAAEVKLTNVNKATEQGDESEKKVSFLATPIDTLARTRSPLPIAAESNDEQEDEDEYECDDSDDDDGDAPCTMMELLIKKEQSQSSEDDTQDVAADADETFDSMAEKFLHQAICAKFTAARTILQLDDLLLKYDAIAENLVMVLTHELTKWWEKERVEAGGPATGGWGTGAVLMSETGDRVSAKVAVETKFKSVYVPLLLNYVASHKEQMMLLEKLECQAKASDKSMRNHTAQLMALYKFDVLDADAILEWWRLLKEPQGVFGHGNGLRSMSSKFVAWLEDEEDEEDDDSEDDSEDDDSDEESDSEDEHEEEFDEAIDADGQGKIVGLDMLAREELMSPRNLLQSLDDDLAQDDAEKGRMMVIGSDDGMDDQVSTSSSLERIEECERKRRISFCTNNVYIHQNGRVRIDKAPVADEQGRKMDQCPPFGNRVDEEEEEEEEEEEDSDDE